MGYLHTSAPTVLGAAQIQNKKQLSDQKDLQFKLQIWDGVLIAGSMRK